MLTVFLTVTFSRAHSADIDVEEQFFLLVVFDVLFQSLFL
jgi:hypothetical protein